MRSMLRLTAVAPFLLLAASRAAAQASEQGWKYTMNMTIDSGDANHRVSMAMRIYTTKRYLRTEFVQVSGMPQGAMAEGMYMIMDTADSTMTSVMPGQRMATVMTMTTPAIELPTFDMHDVHSQVEDLGAGERLLGHATHRYRTTSHGTFEIRMGGKTCSARTDDVSEVWVAPDVDLGPALQSSASHYQFSQQDTAAMHRPGGLPSGTPLRTVTRTTRHEPEGKTSVVTTTQELVELEHGPLEASLFKAPGDFKTMDMRAIMAQMSKSVLDSASQAGATAGVRSLCPGLESP